MKIGIISDSHENLLNLEYTIDWLNENKIKTLIHCGDVSRVRMLEKMNQDFDGKIHLAWGNSDQGFFDNINESDFEKIEFYGEVGELEIENKKIAWTHYPKVARELSKTGKFDLVFYGHTHKPWLSSVSPSSKVAVKYNKTTEDKENKIGLTKMINPGNLGDIGYRASFAVYDFEADRAELKVLDLMKENK